MIKRLIRSLFYKRVPVQLQDEHGAFIMYTWAWVRK